MKKIRLCWSCIWASLAKIHLVDKFLIVFMLLLLFQSAYNIFVNHTATGEAGNIDVIVRTSIAAIFGYFLSTNFIHQSSSGSSPSGPGKNLSITPGAAGSEVRNRMGFSAPDPSDTKETSEAGSAGFTEDRDSEESIASRLQIITASVIGLFCLVVLIVLRDVSALRAGLVTSASASATIAQFRDIVSGCIGFLIGCPTSRKNR